jgi:hypothetical protein
MLARRQVIIGAAAAVGSAMIRPLVAAPFEWREVLPAEAGFASDVDSRLIVRAWVLPRI